MSIPRRWPLQTYLLALLSLIGLTQIVAVGLIVRAGLDIAEQSTGEGIKAAATAAAKNVELTFDFARQLVVAGAKRPGLIQFLDASDDQPVQDVLDVILQDTPYYSTVYVLDADLWPVRGAPRTPLLQQYREHLDDFRRVLEGGQTFVSPVLTSRISGDPVVVVAARAGNPSHPVGLLVGEISLRKVSRDLLSLRFGEAGFAQLVTSTGAVLAGPEPEQGVAPELRAALALDSPQSRVPFVSAKGARMVASWVLAPPWDWRVVVVEPEAEAREKVQTLRTRTAALLAIGLLLVAGAGFLLMRAVALPLRRATQVASRISHGELERRMPDSPIEELSVLSKTFNEMTDRLVALLEEVRGQNRDLEDRVAKRTQEYADARTAAEVASRAKGEFLTNLSHEVRTPLNGVLGMCESLLQTELTVEQRDSVQTLTTSAELLLGIIDDLLDVSKAEAGKLELEEIDLDPGRVVEEVAAFLSPRAFKKGLEVLVNVDFRLTQRFRGDPNRLRQVLLNLLGNAVKFTDRGTVTITAAMEESSPASASIRFEVTDTGIGIPAEAQRKLFNSFTQVDTSTTRRFGGTGLGLAISARLVGLMGGLINVDSMPGVGSRFWFRLRLPLLAEQPPTVFGARRLAGLRALCVDAHEGSRQLLQGLLAAEGMSAEQASDEAAALELARCESAAGRPLDVAIVDGALAGVELVDRLRALPGLEQVPMLVLAGQVGSRCGAIAGVTVLAKPVRRAPLRLALLQLLLPQPCPGEEALAPVAGPVEPPSGTTPVQKILVVEDDSVSRRVVVSCLTSFGYTVDTATNGREAVRKAERGYDAILMDCHMPEMDGFEATRCIRRAEHGSQRRVPIIALTARVLTHHRDEVFSAGMDDYLTKPVSRAELRERLSALFRPLLDEAGPTPLPARASAALDPEALAELRFMAPPGVPLVAQTAAELLGVLPLRLVAIEAACARGDASGLCLQAHSLKGAVATVGATRAASLCAELEALGEVGQPHAGLRLLEPLRAEADALCRALEELIERERRATS